MALLGLSSLLGVAVMIGGRELLAAWQPWRLVQWEYLLRHPLEQQITGFVLVGLLALALLLPVARAVGAQRKSLWFWRTVHASVGALAVAGTAAHTGLRLGTNLNLWATGAFLLLCLLGGITAIGMGKKRVGKGWLKPARKLHVVLFWPALALIGLHVFACYYF